ncbi:Protein of unknown function (DUF2870), putative [Trypanosoma equiperdum]|uniref:Uncharacterized protein n=3 Tax=Trypanozoon TaxID=39700 RepID=D0A4B5_TRYB9|nr:hypothetical protein, conserved [Trypanosoma brucei gambiense DAL972]RHW69806.1 hypothetical protein DPX39_100105900 [Trypanosoma brucei equiperdum]CBH16109.1 hypothetical protein, conserved [Trypanosoma brucei gambiense DAL972]SCU67139.1 Protein of unknown function (DUF2870), putative [Trypanosoma equiperdum]|eukprot:XP_011778373.1 hypothetical protein, conserved [Trypanosoma brucei gambiense DAL972]
MVLIECKRLPKDEYSKDYDVFLVSMPGSTNIGEATDALQKMRNTRVRIKWMCAAAKQLAKDFCSDEQKHHLLGAVEDAERYMAIERAENRQLCSQEDLDAHIAAFKGSAMILFPAECSGTDAVKRLALVLDDENTTDLERSKAHRLLSIIDDGAATEDILQGPAVMWWSGKPLDRNADFTKYVGKNEKTKITVKLAAKDAPPPPREPAVDAKTQSEMMAFYFKKQEEMKKLIEDEDLTYGNSAWADPRGLRSQLHGFDGVKYKPG